MINRRSTATTVQLLLKDSSGSQTDIVVEIKTRLSSHRKIYPGWHDTIPPIFKPSITPHPFPPPLQIKL